MRYLLLIAYSLMLLNNNSFANSKITKENKLTRGTPIFNIVKTTPVVQSMVAGSSQYLQYTINVPHPPPANNPMIVKCDLNLNGSPDITASNFVAENGCASPNGVAISTQTGGNILVNVQLSVANSPSTSGTTGTLTFYQKIGNKKGYTAPTIELPLSIPSSRDRTVTFINNCSQPVWFGVSSSSLPSKTNANHACSTDTDCNTISAYSKCVSGVCGGGWCQTGSDCLVTANPNPSPTANDPPVCNAGSCSYCSSDSDCVGGSEGVAFCNSAGAAANYQCYWVTPAPADAATNKYKLDATGGANTEDSINFTDYSNQIGYSLLWSGGFAGRTGCGSSAPYSGANSCTTAGCNTGGDGTNGSCAAAEGFAAPSTQVEITFVSTTPDTYDVTIINGTNIPISLRPANAASPTQYGNPYHCGLPGSTSATNLNPASSATTLGACSWNFENSYLPGPMYRWVDTATATQCSSTSTCTSAYPSDNYVCGLTSTNVGTSPGAGSAQTTCGTSLGYWSEDEICATNSSFNAGGLDCQSTGTDGVNTYNQLLGCTGTNAGTSCYTAGAGPGCCGCTNWGSILGINVPTSTSIVSNCASPNTGWQTDILPNLKFLKEACPSAYVYPFDDKASTFTCPQNSGQSGVSYVVEFCPQ
ncbi:MAG: thaumatin family protein [Legionellaceae bacterium]|nr:thaumatin family protein [Legionellaceae bacterium]